MLHQLSLESRKKGESVFLHYFCWELWIIMKGRHLVHWQMWHNLHVFLEFTLVIEDAQLYLKQSQRGMRQSWAVACLLQNPSYIIPAKCWSQAWLFSYSYWNQNLRKDYIYPRQCVSAEKYLVSFSCQYIVYSFLGFSVTSYSVRNVCADGLLFTPMYSLKLFINSKTHTQITIGFVSIMTTIMVAIIEVGTNQSMDVGAH